MSSSSSRFSFMSFVYLIILVVLIYTFHLELFVTGIRLYTSTVSSPHAEQLLGDYYRNNARLSNDLSFSFYNNALKKHKQRLGSGNSIEQANDKLQIGQLYLCGKGVPQNRTEAKRWFDDAQQTFNAATKNDEKGYEELANQIKQGVTSSRSNEDPNLLPACQFQTGAMFIQKTLKSL